MEDKIEACPECDDSSFHVNKHPDRPDYHCPQCGHRFDTPRIRDRKHTARGPMHGIARTLDQIDDVDINWRHNA